VAGGATICHLADLLEVLGYHLITPDEIADLQEFPYSSNFLAVSDEVANKAIALRQQKNESGRFYCGRHRVGK
jgi:hypothetical protein